MIRNIAAAEIRTTAFEVSLGSRADQCLTNLTDVVQLRGTLEGNGRPEFTLQRLVARGTGRGRRCQRTLRTLGLHCIVLLRIMPVKIVFRSFIMRIDLSKSSQICISNPSKSVYLKGTT